MPKIDPDEFLTSAQAAEELGRGLKGLRGLQRRGELVPVLKFPGKTGGYLFRAEDVAALAARHEDEKAAS